MPITEGLMDDCEFEVRFDPSTPTRFLDSIDVYTYLWGDFFVTPTWFRVGDLSDANLVAQARFRGVYLAMGQNRLSITGVGQEWWLGGDGDGGVIATGIDSTDTRNGLAAMLDSRIFNVPVFGNLANGLTRGSTGGNTTSFSMDTEGGDTRREMLDTICAIAPGGPYMWRINPDRSVDVKTQANLWPTTTTPTAILANGGGRDGNIAGFATDLKLDKIDGSEVRSGTQVDWNDGVNNGTDTNTLPATYVAPGGSAPTIQTLIDSKPKRARKQTERWRSTMPWAVTSQGRASALAGREGNERKRPRFSGTAEIDVADPWRFDITPGNSVYAWDPTKGLVNTDNQVQYRGELAFPRIERVEQMESPCLEGYGYYLRLYDGVSAFNIVDLTPYVEPEIGPVRLSIGKRRRTKVSGQSKRRTYSGTKFGWGRLGDRSAA